jgi:hypothetical protein
MRFYKFFICILLLAISEQGWSQDSTSVSEPEDLIDYKFNLDSLLSVFKPGGTTMITFTFSRTELYLDHTPDKADYRRYKWHKRLITQQPTKKNHILYYSLACSLYDLNKMAEAEKMFLTIINSEEAFYTDSYYHSSDIPGDTTKNTYGYGSYISNYKNYAAKYLTKIYIEQKAFDKALQYLEDAVHKYIETYNCGTGHMFQQLEYDRLYAACYKGLNKHKELVDLLLPDFFDTRDTLIINAIRNLYTQQDIEAHLVKAEKSLEFSMDSSYWYTSTKRDGAKYETTDSTKKYVGKINMILFDRTLEFERPAEEDRKLVTREKIIADFKDSYFYKTLLKIKEEGEETSAENTNTNM